MYVTRAACCGSTTSASPCTPARSSASPASPATARASCSRRSPVSAVGRAARSGSRGEVLGANGAYDAAAMRARACAHVPEDRLRMGLVREFEASESFILGYQDDPSYSGALPGWLLSPSALRGALLRRDGELRRAPRRHAPAHRRCSPAATSRSWCWRGSSPASRRMLLVGQPTRGVDIGAIEFIHKQIVACAMRASACCWSRSNSTRS